MAIEKPQDRVRRIALQSVKQRHEAVMNISVVPTVEQDRRTVLRLPPGMLEKISSGLPPARELGRFATAPRYEAFFKGGKAAQVVKHGGLSPVQHNGKSITEVNKLRRLRFSPAQFANLAFGLVSFVVGQEHLARIDRQIAGLRQKVDEIGAMLDDELAAPVLDIFASIHRFAPDHVDGISAITVEAWWRDLRRVRVRLVAKIERMAVRWTDVRPDAAWTWSGALEELKKGDAILIDASRHIELLAACDACLARIAISTGTSAVLDGVDSTTPIRLGKSIAAAARPLVRQANERCGTNFDRVGDVRRVIGDRDRAFGCRLTELEEQEALRDAAMRLSDADREFCLTFENGLPVALIEIDASAFDKREDAI